MRLCHSKFQYHMGLVVGVWANHEVLDIVWHEDFNRTFTFIHCIRAGTGEYYTVSGGPKSERRTDNTVVTVKYNAHNCDLYTHQQKPAIETPQLTHIKLYQFTHKQKLLSYMCPLY